MYYNKKQLSVISLWCNTAGFHVGENLSKHMKWNDIAECPGGLETVRVDTVAPGWSLLAQS